MKNHESRPTGDSPFPEVNATQPQNSGRSRGCSRRCGRGGRGRSCDRGRGRDIFVSYDNNHGKQQYIPQKWDNNNDQKNAIGVTWKVIGPILVVRLTTLLTFIKHF